MTAELAPDAGMDELIHRMRGTVPDSVQADAGASLEAGPGAHLAVMARLAASLDNHAEQLRRYTGRGGLVPWDLVHPAEVHGAQTNTAGTIDIPNDWQAPTGFAWQIMGVSVILGAGASQWSVWLDSPNDPTNIQQQQNVSGRWEPSDYILMPGRRLVFTSVGGGITVSKWQIVEVDVRALPGFLGLKTEPLR